ncbi:MAG TPA: DUF1707 domain-containing protein [Planosporangium sp.]|jgi:hypothetical protein|nr:DUF1707 domain-containing protein [Planosporangium sp.]
MSSEPRRVRASDAERERYAQIVRTAMSEGRLTLDEGEERLGQVYAAKYRDELSPLVADLPDTGRQGPQDSAQDSAGARAAFRKRLGRPAVVVVVAGVLIGLWTLSGGHFFWPIIPLLLLWFGVLRRRAWGGCGRWAGPGRGSPA